MGEGRDRTEEESAPRRDGGPSLCGAAGILDALDAMILGPASDGDVAQDVIGVEVWCMYLRKMLRNEGREQARAAISANRAAAAEAAQDLGADAGLEQPELPDAPGRETLSATELKVAMAVSEGLSNREIAERLSMSPRTVQTHLAHIFGKLRIRSRVTLALAASRWDDT